MTTFLGPLDGDDYASTKTTRAEQYKESVGNGPFVIENYNIAVKAAAACPARDGARIPDGVRRRLSASRLQACFDGPARPRL